MVDLNAEMAELWASLGAPAAGRARVIQVAAARRGEGASTVARELAFFAARRAGYPNVSLLDDPKAEELNVTAMTKSRTWDERVANFKAYHEYILSQYAFAPIYEPANVFAYSTRRLKLPETIRGTRLTSQTILDAQVSN